MRAARLDARFLLKPAGVENPLTSQLEILLPLAVAWVREQERIALAQGVPLSGPELFEARRVGVADPHRVRLMEVPAIPVPTHPLLQAACRLTNFVPECPRGLALNYAIFVRADCWGNRALLVHELAHVTQYERLGGIEPFLRSYLAQMATVGYAQSALEREACSAMNRFCPGVQIPAA